MNQNYKNFLSGLGSVLDIAPVHDFRALRAQQTPEERLRGHFTQAGDAIRRATHAYSQHDTPAAVKKTA